MSNLTVYDTLGRGLRMGASSGSFFYTQTATITYLGVLDVSTYGYSVVDGFNKYYLVAEAYGNLDGTVTITSMAQLDINYNFQMYWSNMSLVSDIQYGYQGLVSFSLLRGDDEIIGNKYTDVIFSGAGDDSVWGYGGNDKLYGENGDDTLTGNTGNDRLYGGNGNDILMGGTGNDALNGGKGIDYADYRDATRGVTVDLSISGSQNTGMGSDSIIAVEYVIGGNYSDKLAGNASSNALFGQAGKDVILGREGNDLLMGGDGSDTLTGGSGSDTFYFDEAAPNKSSNRDIITDFSHSEGDQIALNKSWFPALLVGTLASDAFYAAPGANRAHDTSDRIIYNSTTGALYYDDDGKGGNAAVQFATLGVSIHPVLTYSDIEIAA